ncbi:MAG: hypothetical protein ABW142_05955 [Thermoleophilaceae bacterium]
MTRRSRWLGVVAIVVALALVPPAAAELQPKAKFRLVSASGREALSFQEEGTASGTTSHRCVGTSTSEVRWHTTRPVTLYVYVFRYGGKPGTSLSTDRTPERYDVTYLPGRATTSRSVNYSETAGCDGEPTNCPETTAPASPFLTGLLHGPMSVNAGIDKVRVPSGFDASCRGAAEIAFGVSLPFGNAAMHLVLEALSETDSAWAVPRRQLLDPRRKRIHDSVTVEAPVSGTTDPAFADQATVSGTATDHLEITLKRLKLNR